MMSMSFPTSRRIYFSAAAGGGVHGMDDGIAHVTTTEVGFTTDTSRIFIMTLIFVGEATTETAIGVGIAGSTEGYPTSSFNKTGEAGTADDIGKETEGGTWKDINLFHHKDNRN